MNSSISSNPAQSPEKIETKVRRTFLSAALSNVSIAWKMVLMVAVLFLSILGITVTAYLGMQSLRYQLSNIYDFMLIPIVAINNADTALADSQYDIIQFVSNEVAVTEDQATRISDIEANNQLAEKIIARYQTEWVTTISPEFTQALREAGKLELQQQEVAALASLHEAFDAYKATSTKYLATVQAGNPDASLANDAIVKLESARLNLQTLIQVNNEFADLSNTEAQAAFRQALLNGGIVLSVGLALGLFMSYLIVVSITSRLGDLTRSAAAMQEGNLGQAVSVTGRDEISILGKTFNAMAEQLKGLFGTLEQRVADRTRALSAVAEVSTAASTILDTNMLLQQVVDLSKERFNLYHAHIYLLDEAGKNLVLASGAGEPGRTMVAEGRQIPLNREQSLVARAAREGKGVTVNDVTLEPDFLPNPLLPGTRSELAVPMIIGDKVLGVFDVQSDIVGRFTDADINIQTTLASQVASAVQNANLYKQAETSAQEAQSLVENAPEAIIIVDLETGLFANPNENAVKLYGLSREELIKVGPAQMSPPTQPDKRDSTEKAMEKIGEAMQGGTPIFEWVHRNGQGEEFLCEVRFVRLPGAHPRVRASVTDITERKRIEEFMRRRAQQQEALNLITQRIQSATSVESALQVTARELGHALGMKPTLVSLDSVAPTNESKDN